MTGDEKAAVAGLVLAVIIMALVAYSMLWHPVPSCFTHTFSQKVNDSYSYSGAIKGC